MQRRLVALCALAVLGLWACGPSKLPRFANPPPFDGGQPRDVSADDDGGTQ